MKNRHSIFKNDTSVHINADRLNSNLQSLSVFGALPHKGTSRVAYSEADKSGREWVIAQMKLAGLHTYIDAAGNIIGTLHGTDNTLKPIASGSHIDTVPEGGNYDGIVGVLSAIEVARTLREAHLSLHHSYQVIVFSNEEGGHVGSRAITAGLNQDDLNFKSLSGKAVKDGIRYIGGDPDKLDEAKLTPGSLAAFVELHIEQGGILENEKKDIGIVEGIVGIKRWMLTFEGVQNHAGTTPMHQRKDALLGASEFVVSSQDMVASLHTHQVATSGKMDVTPNAPNVIPGKVIVSFETRDLDAKNIADVGSKIINLAECIANKRGLTVCAEVVYDTSPMLTDKKIEGVFASQAKKCGFSIFSLPSGAGHDAQEMAKIAPTGMIFVPSQQGISHHQDEYTSPEQVAKGAELLLQTVVKLDRKIS